MKTFFWGLNKNLSLSFMIQEIKAMEDSESFNTFIYHLCQLCKNHAGKFERDDEKEKKCEGCSLKKVKILDDLCDDKKREGS